MLDFIYLFFKTACTTYLTSLHTTFKNREIKLVQFSDHAIQMHLEQIPTITFNCPI